VNSQESSVNFDGVTSCTKEALQNTLEEVVLAGLNQNQQLNQVTILSINRMQNFLIVQYVVVINELCINTCEEQIDSTTLYDDVSSHIDAEILSGSFTSKLQANAIECGPEEIQNAFVLGGTFGNRLIVVLSIAPSPNPAPKPSLNPTSKPSPNPTPKPNRLSKSKKSRGRKSGKANPTRKPTPNPTAFPTPKPTSTPTPKLTPKPSQRTKSRKSKKSKTKKMRERISNTAPLDATKLPFRTHQREREYQPLRKRTPKAKGNQIGMNEAELVGKDNKKSPVLPVSPAVYSVGNLPFDSSFDETLASHKVRIRDHMSDSAPIESSTNLVSATNQKHKNYQSLRKRIPQKNEDNRIEIYEEGQVNDEDNESSPDSHTGGDKMRARKHTLGTTPLVATKLSPTSDHTGYQPLRKRIWQKNRDHQAEIFEVEQMDEKDEKIFGTPVLPSNFPTDSSAESSMLDLAFDEELASKRIKDRGNMADDTKLLFTGDQRPTKYQPLRRRVPQIKEYHVQNHEAKQVEEDDKSSYIHAPPPDVLAGRPIYSPTFYPTFDNDRTFEFEPRFNAKNSSNTETIKKRKTLKHELARKQGVP